MNFVMIVVLLVFVVVSPAISQVEVSSSPRLSNVIQPTKKVGRIKKEAVKKKATSRKTSAKKAATKKKVVTKKLTEADWQKENEAIEKALKNQETEPRWTEEKVRGLNIDEFMNNLPDILSSVNQDVENIKSNAMQIKKELDRSKENGDYSKVSALLEKMPKYESKKELTSQEKAEFKKLIDEFSRTNEESSDKKDTVKSEKKKETKASSVVVIPKKVVRSTEAWKFPLELGIGLRMGGYRSEEQVNPEKGFGMESSNQTGMRLGFDLQAKYKQFALKFVPLKSSDRLDLEFYGSSLGSEKIITGPVIFAEVYVVEKPNYNLFVGLGIERVKVDGTFSIGGFPANLKYKTTPVVYEFGGEWKYNDHIILGGSYELSNSRFVHEFPGVPDLVFKRGGCLVFRVSTMFRTIKIPRRFGL